MTADQTRLLKHELRTPINHIIGYSELVLEAAMDEDDQRVVQRARSIHDNGKKLAILIDRHLAACSDSTTREVSELLRQSVSPVIAAIFEYAEPQPSDAASWTTDLRRIQSAAQKLNTVLESQVEPIP